MKNWKLKLFVFVVLFFCSFFGALITTSSVNAVSLQGGYLQDIESATLQIGNGNSMNATISNGNAIFRFGVQSDYITNLHLNFSTPTPTNSLVFFNVEYKIEEPAALSQMGSIDYVGLAFGTGTQLWESCSDSRGYVASQNASQRPFYSRTCSYLIETRAQWNYIETTSDHRIAKFYPTYLDGNYEAVVIVSPLSIRQVNWNALSADDRQWLIDNMPESTDVSSVISTIESQASTLNNSINNLRQDTQAQTDAIEQGNDDAQDRWEADKAEEAEREEQGQDDADTLGSTFHFEIRNPFMGLLGLFTNNCPVSIPTIAGMLGSSQTTYPCWFSSQTRGILTPVIGISASVLLFGFIVRGFLRKGNFSGGIEI